MIPIPAKRDLYVCLAIQGRIVGAPVGHDLLQARRQFLDFLQVFRPVIRKVLPRALTDDDRAATAG